MKKNILNQKEKKGMNIMFSTLSLITGWIASTTWAFAQSPTVQSTTGHTGGNWGSFQDIVRSLASFLNTKIIPIIISLTLVYFLWNLAHFVGSMDNEKERIQFRKYAINAVIGMTIMLSVWGLVSILTNTFFRNNPIVPQLPTSDNYH
jgi:hypothetical protein